MRRVRLFGAALLVGAALLIGALVFGAGGARQAVAAGAHTGAVSAAR